MFDALRSLPDDAATTIREPAAAFDTADDLERHIEALEKSMQQAARDLEFEQAAEIRDRIQWLRTQLVFDGQTS